MLLNFNKYIYLILSVCFLITAAIVEDLLLNNHPEKQLIEEFQNDITDSETELEDHLLNIEEILNSKDYITILDNYLSENDLLLEEDGVGFLVYENGVLNYWSDRSIAFYNNFDEYTETNGFVKIPNGYYLINSIRKDSFNIVGLHLVKHNYEFENKYLKNEFFKGYNIPKDYRIVDYKNNILPEIRDKDGEFLFSLLPAGEYLCTTGQLYFPAIIYLLGLIILFYYFRREFDESTAPFFLKLFTLAASLFIVYWLHIIFKVPKVFLYIDYFNPEYFAYNWIPSLGDFFFISLLFLFWMYNFGVKLNIEKLNENEAISRKAIVALLLLFSAATYLLVNFFIEILINNSTLSFSFNKITQISAPSVLGIFSIGLFILAAVFFTIKVFEQARDDFKFGQATLMVVIQVLILFVIQYVAVKSVSYKALLFFIVVSLLANLFSKNYLQKFTLSYLVIFVSAASLYSLIVIYSSVRDRERNIQKLFAVTLVRENDPAANVLLENIWNEIIKDSVIPDLLISDLTDESIVNISDHIKQTYFDNSYFRKYLINIYACYFLEDPLYLVDEDRTVDCTPWFDEQIRNQGTRIGESNFYFMDNMNGRISYIGKLDYKNLPPPTIGEKSRGVSIFVELHSDLLFEGIGFPELLIGKSMEKSENYKKFNYAKYYGGVLTDMYGDYNYNSYIDSYLAAFPDISNNDTTAQEFVYKKWDGLEHLIYRTTEDNYVIVSRDVFTVADYFISFPYLFVFYFLTVVILLLSVNRSLRKRRINFDLKFKIQAAIISIVFVSLLLVALVTILYNVEQYRDRHLSDLDEKLKSIAEEIDLRLESVDEITEEWKDWLAQELADLSNIFRTDINIYGTDGDIIASSRSEIFDYNLVSTRINSTAYFEIVQNALIDYFQPEKIGELSYLSAYRPIVNNRGKTLGIINLPYFIRQDNYRQEISTFVVAFINLYVLLFFASIIVAIFISNQITRPLVLIQENLKKMGLGKRNEPIQYNRQDEIGSLVKEYNKKVDELALSAELLARSERESAWREMAKQIAHEIKNPLTPMKLNIQHLQRAKEGKGYDEYIERVTATLIEQIDNLSNIATEFSNFAKIPTARNQVFLLADQLKKVLALFESHEGVTLKFFSNGLEAVEVNADREQLSRAVINLIKNGIQSLHKNKQGEIEVSLSKNDSKIVVAISDNGCGIPVDLREKLFSPSFTTKTSGMGLGLAIVKNIVENFSGRIWFETELEKGTTFFIEMPVSDNGA